MTAPPSIPDGSVIITPNQVYDEVRATREAVGELTRKLDGIPGQVADHEKRLRALEERRIPHSSVTIGAGVLSSLALIITAVLATVGH